MPERPPENGVAVVVSHDLGCELSPEARLYLDLLKKCLTRQIFDDDDFDVTPSSRTLKARVARAGLKILASRNMRLVRRGQTRTEDKIEGIGWGHKEEILPIPQKKPKGAYWRKSR